MLKYIRHIIQYIGIPLYIHSTFFLSFLFICSSKPYNMYVLYIQHTNRHTHENKKCRLQTRYRAPHHV